MKFTIDSKTFQTAMERVMVVSGKKGGHLSQLFYIVITADQNAGTVTFSAQQLDEILTITVDSARVIEGGFAIVDTSEVKPLLSINGFITIEVIDGKYFKASTDKKRSEIRTYNSDADQLLEKPSTGSIAFRVGKRELIDTMQTLAPSLSENNAKPIYQCYCIDPENMAMLTISGFTLILRHIDWKFERMNFQMLIPGKTTGFLANFKKITNYKADEEIDVYITDKADWGTFQGKDFKYSVKLPDTSNGSFMRYMDIINNTKKADVRFYLNIAEVYDVMAQYEKCNSTRCRMGTIIHKIGDKLYSGYSNSKYRTMDELSYQGDIPDGFVRMLDPEYVGIVLKIFKDNADITDCQVATFNNSMAMIHFYNKEYHTVVVPMRINECKDHSDELIEFMKDNA